VYILFQTQKKIPKIKSQISNNDQNSKFQTKKQSLETGLEFDA